MTKPLLEGLKVALVHDWLNGMRGGEKCLEVLCELFPEADLYTLIHDKANFLRRLSAWAFAPLSFRKCPSV